MTARSRTSLVAAALLALCAALGSPRAPAQEASSPARAAIIRLDGQIDALTERSMEMRVGRALERQPRFLVVSIESPGGEYDAARTIAWNLRRLDEQDVTTVAFIRGNALSGATFVAFGCDLVAMAPGGQLGDVMPIYVDLFQTQAELAEKQVAPVRKDLQQLAAERGYPLDVAAAMVDPRVELHLIEIKDPDTGRIRPEWRTRESLQELPYAVRESLVSDQIVCPEGQLLVLGRDEAEAIGICFLRAGDEAALCAALAHEFSLPEVIPEEISPLWWEQVVRFITWTPVKLLLFVVGAIALLVAFASPGQGAPELVAIVAFGAFFFGSYLIGLSDWIEVLIFVVGLGLLAVEVFLTPGFGVMGALGGLAVAASILLSFQRFVIPATPMEWTLLVENLAKTTIACAGALVGLLATVRFLPKTGFLGGLVLEHTQQAAPEPPATIERAPVGTGCFSHTALRPIGKVKIGDQLFDAVAEEGLVDAGVQLVVVGHRGVELVVAERPETTSLPPSHQPDAGQPDAGAEGT